MQYGEQLSFKAGELVSNSICLKILYENKDVLVLEKPQAVFPSVFNRAVQIKLAPLTNFLSSIYDLDEALSGFIIFAKNKTIKAHLKNLYGSFQFELIFRFWCRLGQAPISRKLSCDLPIAWQKEAAKGHVSQRLGKKSETHFFLLKEYGPYALWEARTTYLRPHQIRLHAQHCKLPILGDRIYNENDPLVYLSSFKKNFKKKQEEKPLYRGIHLHLCEVKNHSEASLPQSLQFSFPMQWNSLEKCLSRHFT